MRVLIRGAGDIATGIALRLYRAGLQVAMTDIPKPTAIRRTVCFSQAIVFGETVVEDVHAAIAHIAAHSTYHSEAIITENAENAQLLTAAVDSAAVYVNASTRFTDGGEFGLGCEMGISTQKLHARGPMGLRALTTYKYVITGNGQIRR